MSKKNQREIKTAAKYYKLRMHCIMQCLNNMQHLLNDMKYFKTLSCAHSIWTTYQQTTIVKRLEKMKLQKHINFKAKKIKSATVKYI